MIIELIKNFTFEETDRAGIILSDSSKVRLNAEDKANSRIMLKRQGTFNDFSTDLDIYVETDFIEPNGVEKWLKFEAIVVEDPETYLLPSDFLLRFKVKTTTGNYFWNALSNNWEIATANDWCSEADINANLPTFPISDIGNKKIAFVVNLITINPLATPELKELKLLGLFNVDFYEDLVFSTLLRKLNTEFRSTSEIVFRTTSNISSVNLATILENRNYNVTGISRVFNTTQDSLSITDLFSSYVPGPAKRDGFTNELGVVNFSTPIPSGHLVSITFFYLPEIRVTTGVDFYEAPVFPAIVFEDIEQTFMAGYVQKNTSDSEGDYIRDKAALTAVVESPPEQRSYRFNYAIWANRQKDQARLPEDLKRFLADIRSIKSYKLYKDYDLNVTAEFSTGRNQKVDGIANANLTTGSFDVLGVDFYLKQSSVVPLIGPGQFFVNISPQ